MLDSGALAKLKLPEVEEEKEASKSTEVEEKDKPAALSLTSDSDEETGGDAVEVVGLGKGITGGLVASKGTAGTRCVHPFVNGL